MEKNILAGSNPEISEREKTHGLLARNAAAEGIVLLRNEGVLPLTDKKIALFGTGARMTIKGGTGSGDTRIRKAVSIEEGLEASGFSIVSKSWIDEFDAYFHQAYHDWKEAREREVKGMFSIFKILGTVGKTPFDYPTGIPITDAHLNAAVTDTAIYVIARQAGEGKDRSNVQGDFRLDDLEYSNLQKVASHYKNVIVVLNAGGMIDLSFADAIANLKGLLYFVQGGAEGGNALADILSGKTNPSGKLTDTWAAKYEDYSNSATFSHNKNDVTHDDYTEGIYIGYRYFDSFHLQPRHEFGFGLSYTKFDLKIGTVSLEKTLVKLPVSVKNTGKVPGKEVVQAYVTAPFTPLGQEFQRLVAFVKTPLIPPGKTEQVILSFEVSACASYVEWKAAYLLSKGNYVLRVGNSSRHTQVAAVLTLPTDVVTEQCVNICPPKSRLVEIVPPARKAEDWTGKPVVPLSPALLVAQQNRYDSLPVSADEAIRPKIEGLSLKELCTLVVGGGIRPKALQFNAIGASGNTTPELFKTHGIPNISMADGPAGLKLATRFVATKKGVIKPGEMFEEYNFGFFGKVMSRMVGKPEEGTMHYQYVTAWPVGTLLAQTWNPELIREVGKAVGREMQEFGVTLWLAPGMNLHRNPLCGRNFEYYSEDPVLSGIMASAMTQGVQTVPGKGTTIKHFACNNQEDNRNYSSSNLSERTLREIYLKGFEIAVKTAQPKAIMSSYNKVNGVYSPESHDLLTKVLRQEWNFQGLVMSDWTSCEDDRGNPALCMISGNDLLMPGTRKQGKIIEKAVKQGVVALDDLQRCAGRVLRAVADNTTVPYPR